MATSKDQEDTYKSYSIPSRETEEIIVQKSDIIKPALVLESYNFSHPRRGTCVIINNAYFDKSMTGQNDRDGTEVDAVAMESVFISMGFDVIRHNDLRTFDLSITMRKIAEEDHSDADCFACVILSHGVDGYIFASNGRVALDSLFKNFKGDVCPSLAGKPKFFFVQACRGAKYDWGVEVADSDKDEPDALSQVSNVHKIPVEADFLFAYSVVPGYFSWRNNVDGSWFMQAIYQVFREYSDELELQQLMTLVCKAVAYNFQSCTDEDFTTGMKQVPCIVSTLTKQVFFKRKY